MAGYTIADLQSFIQAVGPSAAQIHDMIEDQDQGQLDPSYIDLMLVLAGVHGIARRQDAATARRLLTDVAAAIETADENQIAALTGKIVSSGNGTA